VDKPNTLTDGSPPSEASVFCALLEGIDGGYRGETAPGAATGWARLTPLGRGGRDEIRKGLHAGDRAGWSVGCRLQSNHIGRYHRPAVVSF